MNQGRRTLLSLLGLLAAAHADPASALQEMSKVPAVQKVASESDLRPRTSEERAKAEHFNIEGMSLLKEGIIALNVEPDGPLSPSPPPGPGRPAQTPSPTVSRESRLKAIICQSDAVLIGHSTSSRAMLNRNETFLFTDFSVAVERAVRPATMSRTVTVSMLGGEVELAGRRLSAHALPLPALNLSYLFFLRRLEGTTGYEVWRPPQLVNFAEANVSDIATGRPVGFDDYLKELLATAATCKGRIQ